MQGLSPQNPRGSRSKNSSWVADTPKLTQIPRVLRPTRVLSWLIEMTKRMGCVNEKEGKSIENVVDSDPGEGNTVDGVHTRVSREGYKEDDALREDDEGCLGCWLSRRCGKGW